VPIERRRSPRVRLVGDLRGRLSAPDEPVLVREISLGGMAIETSFPFPTGEVGEFQLELGDGTVVELRARAAHSHTIEGTRPLRYLTGFEFIDEPGAPGGPGDLMNRVG
jgi:hypothetical protein